MLLGNCRARPATGIARSPMSATIVERTVSLAAVRSPRCAAQAARPASDYPAAFANESRITTVGTNLRDTASSVPNRVLRSWRHAFSAISAIGMRTLVSLGDRNAATSESS